MTIVDIRDGKFWILHAPDDPRRDRKYATLTGCVNWLRAFDYGEEGEGWMISDNVKALIKLMSI